MTSSCLGMCSSTGPTVPTLSGGRGIRSVTQSDIVRVVFAAASESNRTSETALGSPTFSTRTLVQKIIRATATPGVSQVNINRKNLWRSTVPVPSRRGTGSNSRDVGLDTAQTRSRAEQGRALGRTQVRPHVRPPHRRTPRHPRPRTRMTPKTAGWDELHLSENPAVELLESLGYTYLPPEDLEPERPTSRSHPHRPPRRRPQAPEPLALRDQHRHGYQGGHTGPRDQSRRGQREALHLPHLRHRAGTGPRRRTEEPHRQIPRLRQP